MKKRRIFIGGMVLGLMLLIQHNLLPESGFKTDYEASGFKISFKFLNPNALSIFLTQDNLAQANEIVQNLLAFEKETQGSQTLREANFEFIFNQLNIPRDFSDFIVRGYPQVDEGSETVTILKTFMIEESKFKDGKVAYLRFYPLDKTLPLENSYQIYNLSYDPKGNVLDRILLKSIRDSTFNTVRPYYKFQEGKRIEYRNYNPGGLPTSFSFKTFILDKSGSKIWLDEKQSLNRIFDGSGFVTQETTRITTYSYSSLGFGQTYAIYNVSLHPKGELSSYEIIFPKLSDVPYSEEENLEINFVRDDQGVLLKKMIRKYRIVDQVKQYYQGTLQEFTLENGSRIKASKEETFDIKPGTLGFFPEERNPKEALYIWNLSFGEGGQVIKKRVLQTNYIYPQINGAEEKLQILGSLKNIELIRDPIKRTLKKIQVDYYDFSEDRNFVIARKVEIEVLETIITGDPVKIKLIVQSQSNPELRDEQVIIQDCNYIMNEATSGKLFDQKRERAFDVHVEEISEGGESLKVVFYDYTKENGLKKYSTKESRTLSLSSPIPVEKTSDILTPN